MPRLSCFVANATAPTARISPDIAKKYRDARVKSNVHCLPSPEAPSRLGLLRIRERPSTPRIACVNRTAVNSETIVPIPSVNANPLTPADARTKRMNAVSRVITFASMIVAMPFL